MITLGVFTYMISTLKDIFTDSPVLSYEKNQVIIHAEDVPSGVFLIKSGVVKKTALLENGREITLRIYSKGALFPLIWAFIDRNAYFYRTVTTVQLQKVSREVFISKIKQNPALLYQLTTHILSGDHELFTRITHELSGDSYHRVVSSLVLMVKRLRIDGERKGHRVRLNVTHQEIADNTGLTRETVSMAILKLKEKQILSATKQSLVVKNVEQLHHESTIEDTFTF